MGFNLQQAFRLPQTFDINVIDLNNKLDEIGYTYPDKSDFHEFFEDVKQDAPRFGRYQYNIAIENSENIKKYLYQVSGVTDIVNKLTLLVSKHRLLEKTYAGGCGSQSSSNESSCSSVVEATKLFVSEAIAVIGTSLKNGYINSSQLPAFLTDLILRNLSGSTISLDLSTSGKMLLIANSNSEKYTAAFGIVSYSLKGTLKKSLPSETYKLSYKNISKSVIFFDPEDLDYFFSQLAS